MAAEKVLIFIPTYNERENLEPIYGRIRKLDLRADLLILDDNSPDGTGEIANRISSRDKSVYVIHRGGKNGIGSAHRDGIRWAYGRGYTHLLTMDCDFTHQPEDIPAFVGASSGADVVVGSRYMDPASLREWSFFRRLVTNFAHFLTKHLLRLPQDTSGAFRLYRLDRIPHQVFERASSDGYAFFFESLHVLALNGFAIREIPIVLPARSCGRSKMTVADAVRGLWKLFETAVRVRMNRRLYLVRRPSPSEAETL